jgi:hypothetical protein
MNHRSIPHFPTARRSPSLQVSWQAIPTGRKPLHTVKPQTIPYATPAPRTNPGYFSVGGRWAIGCFGYIVLSVLWFVALSYFLPAFERTWIINGLPPWVGFAGWCVMTGFLLTITLWLRLRYGYKGYGYGILSILLLLIGLSLLLLSICGTGHL